jgi:hypothetical protein
VCVHGASNRIRVLSSGGGRSILTSGPGRLNW